MSEATDTTTENRAVVPVRERLIVQAPVAIWDTADFEQMQRVAMVLTRSGLVPESLCISGDKDEKGNPIWLPIEVIAARCTLVCNQARLWGADPLNVLQCTSLINGRLMYEGKLVAAVVQAMTGVKLRYKFGLWDTDHIEFAPTIQAEDDKGAPMFDAAGIPVMIADPTFLHGAGDRLAVRCYDPEDADRFVDGSVGLWKNTRSGSPWSAPANWPRQLRYRGSREWTRAYEPGVLLGILADGDQEVDDFAAAAAPRTVGLIDRLKGEQDGAGFDNSAVHAATGGEPPPKPRAPRKPRQPAAEAPADDHPTETAGAQPAESEPGTSETATDASEVGPQPEEGSGPSPEAEAPTQEDEGQADTPDDAEIVQDGHAAEGETYFMAGDGLTAEGTRITYKDGVRFSTSKDPTKFPVYAEHAPELPEVEEEEPSTDAQPEAEETIIDPETDALIKAFGEAVEAAKEFDPVKVALQELRKNGAWAKLDEDDQNAIRADVWNTMVENFFPGDIPNHLADVSAWRLWIEAQDDAEVVEQSLSTLEDSEAFQKQQDATKEQLRAACYARVNVINAGGEE